MKNFFISFSCLLLLHITSFCQEWDNEGMPVRDLEGNVYRIIMTETGVWMANNLTTFKLNDGKPLKYIRNKEEWAKTKEPAYGFFSTDVKYAQTYGAIYNWYAVATEKLCPEGYHVPSVEEWDLILDYAGQSEKSQDNPSKLKEQGTSHWKAPNVGASNDIHFTALPAGFISFFTDDAVAGTKTLWWTSTESKNDLDPGQKPTNAEIVGLSYNFKSKTMGTSPKEAALPVRCIANE
jgi:uncharacterized protein (TIGR02145 family)